MTISVSLCVPAAAGFVELIVSSPCCLSAAPGLPGGAVAGHVVGTYRPNPQQSVCQTTRWPSRPSVGVHAAASLVLAALSAQTLKNLPGRICGRSLSSLVHVLLRGRPSFVYMTEIWQQSLSLLYAHVQCGSPLRFPFPRRSPSSLFFHSPARIPDLPVPVQSQGKEDCYVCSDCRCSRTC